jgi:serine/threonine-protein phosphatase PGAM5
MTRLILILLLIVPATASAVLPTRAEPTRTVVLIRHGEYVHGDESVDEGHLVTLGKQQSRMVAARLDAWPIDFDSIQASTYNRARETGEIIAQWFPQLQLTLHDDLRECTMATWRQDIMENLDPGEAEQCEARLERAFARIFVPPTKGRDEHDIVVCHGNVIRWMVTKVLGVEPASWLQMSIANCSITVVQVRSDGAMKLISFGDSGHIPYEMTSYPGTLAPQD